MSIHPTAIVAPGAKLHPTVEVGPYAVIGPNVEIGEGTVVGQCANISGWTTIGKNNVIHPQAVIGAPPQDLKYKGERSFVKIGDNNHFREFSTVHLAEGEDQVTEIGNNNLFMAYVHIAALSLEENMDFYLMVTGLLGVVSLAIWCMGILDSALII